MIRGIPNRRIAGAAAIAGIIAILGLAALATVPAAPAPPRSPEEVTVSYLNFESATPFLTAMDHGVFTANGLNVTARPYTNGIAPIDDVLRGRADIAAGVGELPVVDAALKNEDIRVAGAFDKADIIFLIARNGSGIENVSDLRGKRIGYTPGTMTGFALDRFLALHGIHEGEIVPVPVTADTMIGEASAGRIDGVVTLQPFVDRAGAAWGGCTTVWHVQAGQPVFGLVLANGTWLRTHPDTARRFLISLDQGIRYVNANPDESYAAAAGRIGLDPSYLPAARQQNQYDLSLDRSLVAAMEDEARWMIRENLTNATDVPDFRGYLSPDALQAVSPAAVNTG